MASPTLLTFDADCQAVAFDVWLDDLQLFLQCDSRDGLSLFDLTSGASTAPAVDADSTVRSQWLTRDAAARLAVRSHLPPTERAHFSQYKSAKTLYDAVVARYSSPATAALSRLMLPYLFPDLAAFATVTYLITHLRTSDTRYRAALYAKDHFLSLCPTTLTVDLLEKRLLAAKTSITAVGASRGDPRTPFFEGCSPIPLLPSVASVAAVDLVGTESVSAASAPSERRCISKAKRGKGAGGGGVLELEAAVAMAGGVAEADAAAAEVEPAGGAVQRGPQQQQRSHETPSPQQLREWYAGRQGSGGAGPCTFVLRTGDRTREQCGGLHATQRCFGCLTDAWCAQFPDATEIPRWHDLLRSGVTVFDLDFDAILAAMYAVSISAERDCYVCVPPDPGIEAAALGASESAAPGARESTALGAGEFALSGTASAQVCHTFTLDSGASRSFFRDRTTLTQLNRPVAVSLADPSGGPVLARYSTVLPCPAAPSGSLSGLYLPSFSTNLVSGADLQDVGVDQFTPASQRVTHCTCAQTGRHLATFTRRPGLSLYTLTTESPPVAASSQVAASIQVFTAASRSGPESAPCSCHLLSHHTLLWHHRLGHPSLPRLRGMASRVLVSGLPRSLPPLPPGPAPNCVPCVEGRQRAAPHSSEFPPTEAPLQTLHMDVWGPACVRGQGHERYFLLVVDDYSRYTTVFPLPSKGEVTEVLIDWIRAARRQLRERFGSDFPVLRLHSDRGGEFSSDRLRAFCLAGGIRQTFLLPASPQQNGIAECRIGMVMDVARTSMIHAAAPHFLWPFAVQYASDQPSAPAFVRNLSADKLSSRAVPCVFLGFPPDAPGWQFYHPTSRHVLSSEDVTFDESVPFYRLFPYRIAPLPPPPLFLAPGPPPIDPLPPQGPAPSGVSQVDAVELDEVAADSGASRGAEPGGAGSGGAEPGGAEPGGAGSGGAGPERAEPGGAASGGAEPGAAESGGVEPAGTGPGGPSGALSRRELPSPQDLREWFARHWSRAAGAGGAASAGGFAATGGAGAGGAAGAGTGGSTSTWGAGASGPRGARTGGTRAAGPAGAPGAGANGAAGVGATGGTGVGAAVSAGGPAGGGAAGGTGTGGAAGVGADAQGAGGAARPRPYFVPLLEQVLGLPPSSGPAPPLECPPRVQSESQLQLASPLLAPSPYAGPTGGLAERREPKSRPASPVRTARTSRRVPRPRPPAVSGTHQMALHPSTAPQRVPLPSFPSSSLPALADPASDSLRAASPTVTRLLTTVVTDPSFESTAASALVTELVDIAAHCRLDFATGLVAESASVCPPSVGGECALSTDVLEDRQEEVQCFAAALPHLVSMLLAPEGDPDAPDIQTPSSYAEAIEGPYSSQWQAAMDAEMASWKSTGTYVDDVPPPGANIVSGMWIFRVKRPPGSPLVFKARYVARGFSQRQGVDYFQNFSPTLKMTTLRVLLHVAAQRDYELHSLDFSTAFLQGSLHEEIWPRRPPGFTGSFPPRTQWSLRRPVYGLRQAPREWHNTLRTTLAALGFAPSTADPSLFLRTDTLLPPFYILVYVDDLVFATADTAGLAHVKSELQKRHTCTDLGELRSYLGLQITRDRARRTITLTQSHMVQQVLQRFDFTYSSPQATPLSTRHSLSALHSDESVEPSGPYPELVGCLMYLITCTLPDLAYPLSILARSVAPGRHRPAHMAAAKRVLRYLCSTSGLGLVLGGRSPVVLTGHADASWVDDLATQWSSQGYTFSLGSGSVSWRSTRWSSVLSSSCEAEIYAGAMAAQELRWLTYFLTDLGEPPSSPPVLYVDNKAMLALCREHRLEHRTKHISLRYFLARELQQRGQLCLAYVASQANTADIFTEALKPCDHQRFCTMLGFLFVSLSFIVHSFLCLSSHLPPPQPGAVESGADTASAEPGGADTEGEDSWEGAGSWGASTGGVDPGGPASPSGGGAVGDPAGGLGAGQPPQPNLLETLSHRRLCVDCTAGAGGTRGTAGAGGAAGAGGTRGAAGAGGTRGAAGAGGARATCLRGPGAAGASGAAGAGGAGGAAGAAGAGGAGAAGTALRRPYFYPQPHSSLPPRDSVLRQVLSLPSSTSLLLPLLCPLHTFSPTPKMTTLRVLLHVAAQRDYELHSLDFSTAFLEGSHHEEIWLRRLPRFIGTTLAALGFAPSSADPSLFLHTNTSLPSFYVLVYVNNLVFTTADIEALALVKAGLQERHTCTDLDELRSYLGLQITQDRARRTITLTQSHMVQQVLQRFNFQFSSPQPTPLSTSHSFLAPPSDKFVEPSGLYPELVGCLMYLMTSTRPDLAYPLSLLARYVAPGRHRKVHWDVAKRVLCYLCSTLGMGLVLGGQGLVVLTRHSNASWADDQATQRSSQGYTFSLGSGCVSWRSTRSSSVLSSSCEAEIYAWAMAAQELRWLTYLLTDSGERPRSPLVLYVDNKAMLALCHEQRMEHRTKHIALRYFLAHELQ
ncbi:unnamed protein product [Closterium sp. NIES-54]